MPLSSDALEALRAAVGAQHVRTDHAALASYCWFGGVAATMGPRLRAWPAAVLMPGSTAEVAAAVKACAAHGLAFRALSTGNGALHVNANPGGIVLDLARMNRIVSIDRANQMAVIEPFVTAARLQAAAMQQGMTCHIIGAGPNHSPLASATSAFGVGVTGRSTSNNARNILSLEWVSPAGDIVRIGCHGEDDWFSEEGPGIGFRGMIRGYVGAFGALGVFTRIGYKLYPWAGDPVLPRSGVFPQAGLPAHRNMRFFASVWQTVEAMTAAAVRLNRSGVCFAMLRMPPAHLAMALTRSNTEHALAFKNGQLPEIARASSQFCWQILTMGYSPAQVAHQEKTVRHIVQDTGGRFLDLAPQHADVLMRGLVTSQYVARIFRSGISATSYGVADSFNLLPEAIRSAEELTQRSRDEGTTSTEATEMQWSWPTESRQLWTENVVEGRPDEKGFVGVTRGFLGSIHLMLRRRLGLVAFAVGPMTDLVGQYYGNADEWMRRIKATIDPKWSADSTTFISPKRTLLARMWPVLSPVLFSRPGRFLLDRALGGMARSILRAKPAKPLDPGGGHDARTGREPHDR